MAAVPLVNPMMCATKKDEVKYSSKARYRRCGLVSVGDNTALFVGGGEVVSSQARLDLK